jgi:predicted NUDIX family phosphoesterase
MAGSPGFDELIQNIASRRFYAIRDKEDKSPFALENNTNLRQLSVYILVQQDDSIYVYQRTKGTGEKRLAGMFALPGGHMNALSDDFFIDIAQDATRELYEELNMIPIKQVFYEDGVSCPFKIVGVLQNSCVFQESMVELVHTGILVKFDISKRFKVEIKEKNKMSSLSLVSADNINDYFKDSERWLKMLLPWLPQLLRM